jgi:hypothetical protein
MRWRAKNHAVRCPALRKQSQIPLPSEQSRNFFRLMLQVVVHRKDHGWASGADTTEQRIMLTVIARQVDPRMHGTVTAS